MQVSGPAGHGVFQLLDGVDETDLVPYAQALRQRLDVLPLAVDEVVGALDALLPQSLQDDLREAHAPAPALERGELGVGLAVGDACGGRRRGAHAHLRGRLPPEVDRHRPGRVAACARRPRGQAAGRLRGGGAGGAVGDGVDELRLVDQAVMVQRACVRVRSPVRLVIRIQQRVHRNLLPAADDHAAHGLLPVADDHAARDVRGREALVLVLVCRRYGGDVPAICQRVLLWYPRGRQAGAHGARHLSRG
mmetsp:Transcript_28718/g.82146  ORF Transcript_28718/g.82146 Transcript_28718/m.82146 type:complete len:249 (+) Transcript_28718:56-802(+)